MTRSRRLCIGGTIALMTGGGTAAATLVLAGSPSRLQSAWSFGPVAGFEWFGKVTELRGEWTVPRITSSAADGAAATWIAAAAPGGSEAAFIQIGTAEQLAPAGERPAHQYFAFWTDTRHDFRALKQFRVAPGDRISASLYLASGRWDVTIADLSSGKIAGGYTRDETRADFNDAQWLQEDVTNDGTNEPFPYPHLTPTRFSELTVDGSVPEPLSLSPDWMSVTRHMFLAPERVGSGFVIRPMRLSRDAEQYLLLSIAEDAAVDALNRDVILWTVSTPATRMRSEAARFARAVRACLRRLHAVHWPQRAEPLITKLIHALHQQTIDTQPDALPPPSYIDTWRYAWYDDGAAVAAAGTAIRSALNVPPDPYH